MFLASDHIERRHAKIRSFLPAEPAVAILLAAAHFEWMARRAIIAFGTNPNRHIRNEILRRCHGPGDYKDAWRKEVKPRIGKALPEIIPDWKAVIEVAFPLRHRVAHGIHGMPSSRKTQEAVEVLLRASASLARFGEISGAPIIGKRLPVRRCARHA